VMPGCSQFKTPEPQGAAARSIGTKLRATPNDSDGQNVAARNPAARSGHADIVVLQRERADTLARRLEIGVQDSGGRYADGRLATAAPARGSARGRDDRFDLRHFGDAHRVVVVEVGLLDGAVLDCAFLVEQRRKA